MKQESGFTIVEVIISAFVFSVIAALVSGIFVQTLNLERRAFAIQKVQENSQYVLELMAREIRIGSVQNQDSPCNAASLSLIHPVNGNITYQLSNGVVQRIANGVTTEISASDVNFTGLNFCIKGSGPVDQQPSRVTILTSVQNRTGKEIINFNLETTVTSRDVQSEL